MPYKISGTLSDAARIIVIKESDWSIESNTNESVGAYEVDSLVTGAKLVAARKSDGETFVFGGVTPIEYTPPERGVFAGGSTYSNVIDYITISAPGNTTDFGDLSSARYGVGATSNGANDRGVFAAGFDSISGVNIIEYITITSTGNTTNFGDLTTARFQGDAVSNGTSERGIFCGGYQTSNVIDYITISTPGDATDFGDLTVGRWGFAGASNGVNNRGVFAGGDILQTPAGHQNVIDYITITSTANATDFGDLTMSRYSIAATSNGINDRGVFGGGYQSAASNVIDYITISSTGDATDFGDLTVIRSGASATSNTTGDRGVFAPGSGAGNAMDYITISSIGNATDFGDMVVERYLVGATSNA